MTTELKKTSVKIWRPIIDKLDSKMEAMCLRRDAYLNKVLEVELDRLDSEVSIPNSTQAQSFVSGRLDQLDRKTVSLSVRSDLLDQLHDICGRKRIVRDAFFNRLFLLLAASPKLIDRLMFPGEPNWLSRVWDEFDPDGFLLEGGVYPLEQAINPFWGIRLGIKVNRIDADAESYVEPESGKEILVTRWHGGCSPLDSIYTIYWGNELISKHELAGLNTYVPDCLVPGHPAEIDSQLLLDELISPDDFDIPEAKK